MMKRIGIFLWKVVLPAIIALIMYGLYTGLPDLYFPKDDVLLTWAFMGIPFGIHRMHVWRFAGGGADLEQHLGALVLNVLIGALIGFFVLPYLLISGLVKTIRGYV